MPEFHLNEHTALSYRQIEGDAALPTLVFLHEGLGCMALWKTFPDRLCQATGCSGLLYDRQGYGASSPLKGGFGMHFMHRGALFELPRLLSAVIPGRRHILVGHSDGGSIALIYASENPADLSGVVVEAAHVRVEELTVQSIDKTSRFFGSAPVNPLKKYHGDNTDAVFAAWSNIWLSPGFRHWNIEYALPSIQCPVLAIQGEKDPYGTPDQVRRIVAGVGKNAKSMMVPDCGHTPHKERSEPTLEAMAHFIRAITAQEKGV